MFILGDTIPKGDSVEADICIIGAGAAGIVLGLEFENTDYKISIIESGNFHLAKFPDPLYDFKSSDLPISVNSRVRAFGGTTNLWSGRWKYHDDIDFEHRDWLPYSGWPISKKDLLPYYEKASRILGFQTNILNPKNIFSEKSRMFETFAFQTQSIGRRNWGRHFRDNFEKSRNISVYLNTHAICLNKKGSSVESLLVRSAAGKEFSVHAKIFILAMGGIENPRLLLISDIGNEHDQVGRYYMDHPKGVAGMVETYRPIALDSMLALHLSDNVLRQEHILNSHVILEPVRERTVLAKVLRKFGLKQKIRAMKVRNYLEQVPNPENRVMLGEDKDIFGYPKSKVEWNISNIDKETMKVFHHRLKDELQRLGIGELESPLLHEESPWIIIQDSSHHMGTTRMGKYPKTSVVDENCKIHGMKNIFIAGSSVFPTGGYANPTATLTALAVRLAEHIKTNI